MSKNFDHDRRRRLRIRGRRRRASRTSLCMVAYVLNENLRARAHHSPVARRIRLDAAVRHRPRHAVRRLQRVGRDDLLQGAGLEVSDAHLRSAHRLSRRQQILLPLRSRRGAEASQRKRLSDACRAYGIEGWESIDKAADREGHRRRPLARSTAATAVLDYCEEDVRKSARAAARATARPRPLAICPPPTSSACCTGRTTARRRSRRSRRAACRSTCRCGTWCRRTRRAVIGELLRRFDPSYGSDDPIYTPDGEWSYARFERWLASTGVAAWPRLDSGQLDIDGDAFRLMYHVPGVEGLHALRDSLGFIVRARCRSGATGATGRACFRSARRPAATRTPRACSTPRRHALVHGVPARHDRRLSRLAHAGGRHCRRRCPAMQR